MRNSEVEIWVHLVWATWDRAPFINSEIERALHRSMIGEAQRLGCEVLAVGGLEDHVHLLISLPATISIAEVVRQIKGVSSRFANDSFSLDSPFKWQGAYGAFSVSRWNINQVIDYIQNQKSRHANDKTIATFENFLAESPEI